jgi:hypothetical protein
VKRYYLLSPLSTGFVVAQALTRRQATKRLARQPKLRVHAIDQAAFDRACRRYFGERERLLDDLKAQVEAKRQDLDRQDKNRSAAL